MSNPTFVNLKQAMAVVLESGVSNMPKYHAMKEVAYFLEDNGMTASLASRVASAMEFDVSGIDDTVDELLAGFAGVLSEIHKALLKDFPPTDVPAMLENMARNMRFQYQVE